MQCSYPCSLEAVVIRLNIGKKEERLSSKSEMQLAILSKKKPAIKAGF